MSKLNPERILPKLDDNFHESIFFLEIQFSKTPTKEIKEQLINYYIKGVDYYTSINQKDFSLYFQTKLLNIMKDQDHFEKTIQNKLIEEDYKEKIDNIINNSNDASNTINDEIQKQKEQFLFNLSFKKKYNRLKRFNSLKIKSNTKNKLLHNTSIRKDSFQIEKKISTDLPVFNNKLNNNINKTSSNSLFSKIDNTLVDFDKINTLLIIEYTKKLKQYAKMQMELIDKKTDKYLDYIQTNNKLNLLYDDIPDKNEDDAKNIKMQINLNREEWEKFDKSENVEENDDIKLNLVDEKIIALKALDHIFKKINELIKETENQE